MSEKKDIQENIAKNEQNEDGNKYDVCDTEQVSPVKKGHKKTIIIALILCICSVAAAALYFIVPANNYKKAIAAVEQEDFSKAYELFNTCFYYKDTKQQVTIAKGKEAQLLIEQEKYDDAYKILEEIGNDELIKESKYNRAEEYYGNKDYHSAYTLYEELGDYKSSAEKLKKLSGKVIITEMTDNKLIAKALVGKWVCETNENITAEVYYDNGIFTIEAEQIKRSDQESAYEWYMSGKYNKSADTIKYSDCVNIDASGADKEFVYSSGSGIFTVSDNKLHWSSSEKENTNIFDDQNTTLTFVKENEKTEEDNDTKKSKSKYPAGKYTISTTDGLRLREAHNSSAKVFTVIPYNTKLKITKVYDSKSSDPELRYWGKTTYKGHTGWISMYYLSCTEYNEYGDIQNFTDLSNILKKTQRHVGYAP